MKAGLKIISAIHMLILKTSHLPSATEKQELKVQQKKLSEHRL
jgi:hypothetical protein